MKTLPRLLAALLAALTLALAPAHATPVKTEHVEAEIVVEQASIQAGKPFTVAARMKVQPGWHIYWINPGDAGLPPTIDWKLPVGFAAGAIQWPYPTRLQIPGAVNFGYEGDVYLPVTVTAPATLPPGQPVALKAHFAWIVCAELCVPGDADVATEVPVATAAGGPDPRWTAGFATARAALPRPVPGWTFRAEDAGDSYRLIATPAAGGTAAPKGDLFYFNADLDTVESGAAEPIARDGGRILATIKKASYAAAKPTRLRGTWVAAGGWTADIKAAAIDVPIGPATAAGALPAAGTGSEPGNASAAGFAGSLVLALLGGMILNLMPCVFPVLGLKIMGFVHQAGAERRKVALHGLAFTAGVLISFWILAALLAVLRAGGDQLGWGFQLQSPAFVFALAGVMLVFALNMSGVFEFGLSATRVGGDLQGRSGLIGTFFTGFLATVVATPCSAPFLAPALGAAVALPGAQSFLLFTAIGLGLSLPYLLLSLFPQAVRILPRPGAWMETFKQLMAFPLYATVAYLLWVLAGQVDEEGLLNAAWGLVAIAAGIWAYGRWTRPEARPQRTGLAVGLMLVLAGAGAWLGWPGVATAAKQDVVWEKWSPETLAALQAEHRTIYVDFTARWCATCQVNKKLVFHSPTVLAALAKGKVATLRADWTNRDPAITAELARWQRSAVPFTLVYRSGAAEPAVLPEVLTPDIVLKAIG